MEISGSLPWAGKARLPRAERLALLTAGLLGLLWLVETLGAERSALLALSTSVPHLPLVGLLGLASLGAAARRARRAGLLYAALALGSAFWSGLNVPLGPVPTEAPRLRLATFNLHGLSQGAPAVRRALEETGAEVICLQEVYSWNLQEEIYPGGPSGWHVAQAGELAILSRYPLLDWREIELSDPSVVSRPALAARVALPGGPVTVLDVHWSLLFHPLWLSQGLATLPPRLDLNARLRELQADRLLEAVPKLEQPVLMAGDFNGCTRDPAFRKVARGRLDAFRAAGWGFGYTFAADLPVIRIDHVLVPGDWTVGSARVLGALASDHRPLVATLHPPAEPAGTGAPPP